jgi:hypothetical protein
MSNLWFCLEALAGGEHVASEWARLSGEHFQALRCTFLRDTQKRARFVPCRNECGCEHEIIERKNGTLVAVCRCEPWNCEDLTVTPAEVTLLELNAWKLGRAIARAFECDARMADLTMPQTWQIGAKFTNCVPVLLTIQNGRETFRRVVTELAARQRQPFILFTPTSQHWDATSRELMGMTRSGCFDLETNLVMTPTGLVQPRCSPGEMLQAFAPNAGEQAPETVAVQVFAIIEKLDANERLKAPTVMTVFRLYCGRGMSAQAVADKCACSKATVLSRLKSIQDATKKDPKELRSFSPYFNRVENTISDSRAVHIHRRALAHDAGDSDEEPE